jgi:hypothetical protein
MNNILNTLLILFNETLTTAIVIIAVSLLLYNLTRNLQDRVARSSSVVLACMTWAYVADVFVSLDPSPAVHANMLRLQWLGIALMPVALYHLSDALLATTGLPSRGRRRRVIRILYLLGMVFFIAATLTDILVDTYFRNGSVEIQPGFLLILYIIYFFSVTVAAFINVQRARLRCLTRDTRRRMGYLQLSMLTPALGIFPFSLLLNPGDTSVALLLVNASNIVVILMLLFLAYPLSFFGSRVPDRVVKTQLLRFVARGPATALLALVAIIYTIPATRVLGLPGQTFMPFAVVAVVLIWQWFIALSLPWIEKRLIYSEEDDDQLNKLQDLSNQFLASSDLIQLLEAILAASCDYLRVQTAFAVSFLEPEPEIIASVGPALPAAEDLIGEQNALREQLNSAEDIAFIVYEWRTYWIVPLLSNRSNGHRNSLMGFVGIEGRSPVMDLDEHEREMFAGLIRRAAQALDDLNLHTEIYAALEGLLPQFHLTRSRAADVEYRMNRTTLEQTSPIDREQFVEQVRAALRHYWGGPGLTHSSLLELTVVQQNLSEYADNPVRALRAVLTEAIEKQRPNGERKMTSPEWTIYNILELRFVEKHKVRDVAMRLALSEPDLYRKQRVAIEAVAETLMTMESEVA